MRVKLYMSNIPKSALTDEFYEAVEIIGSDVWRDASIRFYSIRDNKISHGQIAPKGMQKYLNEVLVEKFAQKGWEADAGYFYKNETWIRITFRHQMSLGTDFIDALKVCKKEGVKLAVIMAANRDTLNTISPNDAAALVSFEKLYKEYLSLEGALDIPLIIGELSPLTSASDDINIELKKDRPRDKSIPQ